MTQGIHTLDLMLSLAGPIVEVAAIARTTPVHRMETEDLVCAAVRFASGAVGVIDATTAAYPGGPERIELIGTKGTASLAGTALDRALPRRPPRGDRGGCLARAAPAPTPWPSRTTITCGVWRDFLDAIDSGRPPAHLRRGGAQGAPPDRRAAGRRHDRPLRHGAWDGALTSPARCGYHAGCASHARQCDCASSLRIPGEKLNATQSQGQTGRRRRRQQGHRALDRARIRARPAPRSRSARAAAPPRQDRGRDRGARRQGACRRVRPRRQGGDRDLHRGGRGLARRHRHPRQQRLRASAPATTRRAGPRASTST